MLDIKVLGWLGLTPSCPRTHGALVQAEDSCEELWMSSLKEPPRLSLAK